MVSQKQLMLDVVHGRPTARIPWIPRLDLWYRAHQRAGTLPAKYQHATLLELVDDLGWGYHAVIPDFKKLRTQEDEIHRALGVYNLAAMPYRTEFTEVNVHWEQQGDQLLVRYQTPQGELTTSTVYDESMRQAGITITHVESHAFKEPKNYAALCWLFEHAQVRPNPAGYAEFASTVGDRGFATGFLNLAASPMHLIQRELMSVETFFFELNDHPEQIHRLAAAIHQYWQQILAVGAQCAADVLLLGANYDAAIQYPAFFAEHIQPTLAACAAELHQRGKFLLTHTDGENAGLLPHYLTSQFDIADSICPKPMTSLSIQEVREAFGERITIMGGIPSVALVPASMNDLQFERFLEDFFEQIGSGRRLILGISDTTPPGADFKRLQRIARRIEEFGTPS